MNYVKLAVLIARILNELIAHIKRKGYEKEFHDELRKKETPLLKSADDIHDHWFRAIASQLRDPDPNSRD